MLARALFVSGVAFIVVKRMIASQKKRKNSVQSPPSEEMIHEAVAENPTEEVSNGSDDTKADTVDSITMSATLATTVTHETSAFTDGGESTLDASSEVVSGFKSVETADVISIDVEATSTSFDNSVVEGVTPRTNSLKKFADTVKRSLSGSRKSLTSS